MSIYGTHRDADEQATVPPAGLPIWEAYVRNRNTEVRALPASGLERILPDSGTPFWLRSVKP